MLAEHPILLVTGSFFFNKYLLSPYYVPGIELGTEGKVAASV